MKGVVSVEDAADVNCVDCVLIGCGCGGAVKLNGAAVAGLEVDGGMEEVEKDGMAALVLPAALPPNENECAELEGCMDGAALLLNGREGDVPAALDEAVAG